MAETKRGPGRPPGSKNKTKNNNKTSKAQTSKAKEKAQEIQAKKKADKRVIDEIWAIITIAIGAFLAVATFTSGAGKVGEIIGETLKGVFGHMAYVLPFYLILFGALLFARKTSHFSLKTVGLLFAILLMMTTMNSTRYLEETGAQLTWEIMKGFYASGMKLLSGGFIGMILAALLVKGFGMAGCWIFTLVTTFICLMLLINTPVSRFFEKIGDKIEERKLIKEHAHLDIASEDEQGVQVEIHPDVMNVQKAPRAPKKTPIAEPLQSAAKISYGNNNRESTVLQYMQDDGIFERSASGTYGLEAGRRTERGYGIDGDAGMQTASGTFGLTPNTAAPAASAAFGAAAETAQSHAPKIKTLQPQTEPKAQAQSPAATAAKGTADKEIVEKISNKEAKEAMLTTEEINQTQTPEKYKKPPVSLLEKAAGGSQTPAAVLQEKAMKLEETLRNFHVDARVIQVTQGPTVTRYEIQPAVGVKVSSIVRLADDIALNLEAKSIRIEAPIPGKAAVGIEVENESVTMVRLREIIDSDAFKKSKSKITFAVGKDISGNAIVADLKSMPHLLIAGSTGSGKSVCINSIITSFIYKANPNEVKLILIDPKVVELGNYNGIPHLMIPVVTDPSKAAAALNWAVAEMTDRYKKFADEGVKDLESFNEFVRANGEENRVMPQVVIIIDELADLMMAAPSQIEESICRLAQMARAAGMHLIVATQRPSVDVITGVIKANIPSRIAFAVSSQVDSRTILDMQGAEKLVGKGDMLFHPMGMGKPIRVQGTFVSDGEVHKVIEFVKGQVETTEYNEDVLSRIERTNVQDSADDADELLPDAIELVVSSGQASVSMLQRRFRIGYNRAARIVDMMEARGIIGPQDGSRPRQVLLTSEELDEMQNGGNPEIIETEEE